MGRTAGTSGRLRTLLGDEMTVVVRGPAGIGKSTLVHRALRGVPYVVGQSLDLLRDLPYHPLTHALGRPFGGAPGDVAGDVAAALGDRILVVEDAHWSDAATLEVLALLAGRALLVVTSRLTVPFEGAPQVAVIEVPPLDPAAARALARRLHPTLDLMSTSRLVDIAGGNPLLIGQLVAGEVVSPTLVEAVASRVAMLPAVTIEQLAVVALHGRPLPVELLGAAGAGEAAAAHGLVAEHDGRVAVAHALLADAVIELVDDDARRRIHARLAAVCDDADAARHHFDAGDLVSAAECAARAAASAPPASKAQLLALEVEARGESASTRLRLDAAAALIAVNQPATAAAIVAPLAAGDHLTRAEAGWYRSQAAWLAGDQAAAERHCTEAIALVEGSGAPIETRLLVEWGTQRVRTHLGDVAVIDDAQRAWAAANRTGVDRAKARNLLGLSLAHTGRPGWEEHYTAAAALAREDGDGEQELMAMYWLISAYGLYGPMRKAVELGAEMVRLTEQLGLQRLHHHFLAAYAVHRLGTGTASLEPDLLFRARQLVAADPLFRNRAQVDLVVAIALIDQGDPTAARDTLAAGRRFVRSDEDRSLLCVGQAELAWAQGDRLALAAALDELASCPRGFFGMNAMSESAAIHTLLDDPGVLEIPRFEASLMPVVDVVRVERTAFDEWRHGEGHTAIRMFGEAAREWDERGFARFAARCHLAAGRVAAHCRDREQAVRHLGLAAEMASRWGLVPIAEATRNVLAELERQRSRARLSGREIEVLDLVAAGRSTAQIAARLGVGASTVVTHVNSARTKLGAQTRMQAASMVVAQEAG